MTESPVVITVTVRLSGLLRNAYKTSPKVRLEQVELAPGATVAALLDYYGIAHERAHILVVNRYHATLETILQDNDDVRVLPLVAGG